MSDNLTVDPGSWGSFYASIEALTWKLQNARYSQYDLAAGVMTNFTNTVEMLVTEAQSNLNAHASNRTNIHKVNATQIGFGLVDNFKTATVAQAGEGEYDNLFITPPGYNALASKVFGDFGSSLHHQGINPISAFGSLSFLPPDISGSFEGSGQLSGNSCGPMIIEDDGTMVGLRYGATGTSEGLYYFYLPSAEDRIDSTSPIRTNFKYVPPNLPAGTYCSDIYNNDSEVLLGAIKGSSSVDRFISLTNGTFDVSKHYTAYYKAAGMANGNYHIRFMTAAIVGTYVYIFGGLEDFVTVTPDANGNAERTDSARLVVWRVAISAIQAGGTVTLEPVTNWSCKDVYGRSITNADVLIAAQWSSSDANNNPYVYVTNKQLFAINIQNAQRRLQSAVNPANPNQVRVNYHHTTYSQAKAGGTGLAPIAFSILIDTTAKTSVVEDSPGPITISGNQYSAPISSPLQTGSTTATGMDMMGGNRHHNTLVTNRGYLLTRMSGNQPDENPLYGKGQILNFVSRFDAMRERSRVTRLITQVNDPLVTGSALTNNFMKPQLLRGFGLLLTGTKYKEVGYYTYGTTKRVVITGNANFPYKLLDGRTINGFAPNGNRSEIPAARTAIDRYRFAHVITQVDSGGNIISSPSVIWEDNDKSTSWVGCTDIDANLNMTGSFSFDKAEMNALAKAAITQVLGKAPTLNMGLIYVPQDTAVPLIMVCNGEVLRDDGLAYRAAFALVELNYTGSRSGSVTGYTIKRVIDRRIEEQQPSGVTMELAGQGGLNIYKTAAGDYLLGIGCPPNHQTYGGIYSYVWYAAIRAGTGTIEDSTVKRFNHGYYPTADNPTPLVVPGSGICVMDYATNRNNATAVMVMDSMATTYQEFINWTSRGKFILAAQQVEQGYLVYFTAPTQVFLAGNEYTLPAGNIDLRSIQANPANTTFYLYVQLVDEQVSYLITTQAQAPSMTLMYIGSIVTNSTQIQSISVNKKVRVETFELSANRIGSAIPISTGVPSGAGNFAWRN